MAKQKHTEEMEEVLAEAVEAATEVVDPKASAKAELESCKELHALMTLAGIKDIGTLEVKMERLIADIG